MRSSVDAGWTRVSRDLLQQPAHKFLSSRKIIVLGRKTPPACVLVVNPRVHHRENSSLAVLRGRHQNVSFVLQQQGCGSLYGNRAGVFHVQGVGIVEERPASAYRDCSRGNLIADHMMTKRGIEMNAEIIGD